MISGHVTLKCDCCRKARSYDVLKSEPVLPGLLLLTKGEFIEVIIRNKEFWDALFPDVAFVEDELSHLCVECWRENREYVEPTGVST